VPAKLFSNAAAPASRMSMLMISGIAPEIIDQILDELAFAGSNVENPSTIQNMQQI
jgi:hypothetical protein